MKDTDVLKVLSEKKSFSSQDFFDVHHRNGNDLSNEALRKRIKVECFNENYIRVEGYSKCASK